MSRHSGRLAPVLTADLSAAPDRHIVFVHDYALDGGEDLHVGKYVRVADGDLELGATITRYDDGYWYAHIDFLCDERDCGQR